MESEVRELLVDQLKDAYSAEKQALRCMQRTVRKATAPALREGIQMHIEQTQVQIERVEQAMEKLGAGPGRKVCEAMRGLVEEAQHEIEDQEKGPILDLVIVAGMQRIEHYEIAAYGTDIALAQALGEQQVVSAAGDPRGGEADRPEADRGHPAEPDGRGDGRRRWQRQQGRAEAPRFVNPGGLATGQE